MSKRRISNIVGNIEYSPGKYRQISNIAGNVEYKPGKYRQISNIVGNVEYKPGKYRQISNIAMMVEYVPCNPDTEDPRYAEWQSYYDKLVVLTIQYGRNIDLGYWCSLPYDNLAQMRQFVIDETKAAINSLLGFNYDPGEIQ